MGEPAGYVPSGVSRETAARLHDYVRLLRHWQATLNLVSPTSLEDVWRRHIADCLQLATWLPGDAAIADLGSGAGLPGLVLACAMPAREIHLIESDTRKAAFLLSAARELAVNVQVHPGRISATLPTLPASAAWVTARALAPLSSLIDYAQPLLRRGAQGLFPKGRNHEAELTTARESWRFACELHPSITDPESRIVRIAGFEGAREQSRSAGS